MSESDSKAELDGASGFRMPLFGSPKNLFGELGEQSLARTHITKTIHQAG